MRISSNAVFNVNVGLLNQQESNLLTTEQQVSSGQSILTPADNPAGAAQALQVSQTAAVNNQYSSNISAVTSAAQYSDGALQSITTLLQNIQTSAVNAGDGSMNNYDRQTLAVTLQSQLNQMISLANSTDANGNYLFSGFKGTTLPFTPSANGVQYNGDSGQLMIQVSNKMQLPASLSGSSVFMNIKNGNGTFQTTAGAGNAGSGVITANSVLTPSMYNDNSYQIQFVSPNVYSVLDTTNGLPGVPAVDNSVNPPQTLTNQTYVSGQPISFNGIQFTITGTPSTGDAFNVAPSTGESVFTTISNLINTLNTGVTPGVVTSQAQYNAGLSTAIGQLQNDLNNVLTSEASLGATLNAASNQGNVSSNLNLSYQQALASLQDVNYSQAISQLTQQQTQLTASQKAFLQVQNLSLFNYIQ